MNYKNMLAEWEDSFGQFPLAEFPPGYFDEKLPWHFWLPVTSLGVSEYYSISNREAVALTWLSKMLNYRGIDFIELLGRIRQGRVMYCRHLLEKKSGGLREINEPCPKLKEAQEVISRKLLSGLVKNTKVNGFSRGSVFRALRPHLKSSDWFMFDIKDAFPSVTSEKVLKALAFKNDEPLDPFKLPVAGIKIKRRRWPGYFSWRVSRILSELCTLNGRLPQGAPTSPKLFDLAFDMIDKEIGLYAKWYGFVYTRYADNLFISRSGPITRVTREQIVKIVKKNGFECHKKREYHSSDTALRTLGLNVIGNKLHNTRDFKRRLRLLVHHIKWLKKNRQDWYNEYVQLCGMLSFAVKNTLPPKLVRQACYLKNSF